MRIAPPGTEAGTSFMMVISYWDQACALLNYGLLHEDLFFETNGEFFGVWEAVRFEIDEFIDVGDRAVAHLERDMKGKSSGVEVHYDYWLVATVHDGKAPPGLV